MHQKLEHRLFSLQVYALELDDKRACMRRFMRIFH
jgi:hypothetical protein